MSTQVRPGVEPDDVRRCLDLASVPWQPVHGADAHLRWRILRRDSASNVVTAVVQAGRGGSWSALPPVGTATTILYVLDGRLHRSGDVHGPGTMVVLRPGASLGTSQESATVLMVVRPGPGACPSTAEPGAAFAVHVSELPEVESVVDGRPAGIIRRILWQDDDAGGDIRLLTVPPGFTGVGVGYHPCSEEILCLDGSILADDQLMSGGWFLYNPVGEVHGTREYSEHGALLLEWHDGPWDLVRVGAP